MTELTQLLTRIENGDDDAFEQFLAMTYGELRKLASAKIRRESSATLQITELVNEAYIRLVDKEGSPLSFQGGAHFFGAASEAMRRILVERARRKLALKRGAGNKPVSFDETFSSAARTDRSEEIVAVHEALDELQIHNAEAAELVKLRYFVGLPHKEAAEAMNITKRVADRLWLVGRTWLFKRLEHRENTI